MFSSITFRFDLFGTSAEGVVADMNKNFQAYGVLIKQFTLKQVRVPNQIVEILEMTTLTSSRERRLEVETKVEDQKGEFEEERVRLGEASENKKLSAEQTASFAKSAVQKEVLEVEALAEKSVSEREAETQAAVLELEAQAAVRVAKLEAETNKIDREISASTQAEVAKLKAQAEAYKRKKHAEAMVAGMKLRADGMTKMNYAEGEASQKLASRRQFEVASKRLDVIESVAENPMVRIASTERLMTCGWWVGMYVWTSFCAPDLGSQTF